ncbi:MAG: sulfatase [Calditrichota bacterium]
MTSSYSNIQRRKFNLTGASSSKANSRNSRRQEHPRPNIIWMIADDAGWGDFGCYGNPVIRTPNIDQMAAQGLRFTNAFATAPQCSPSRASIWTGKYAHSTGTEDLHDPLPAEDRPFFLAVGFYEPHRPYLWEKVRSRYNAEEVEVPIYLPSTLQVRKDLSRYYTEISRMDKRIGRIIAYLEDKNLIKETLLIFFSDHGLPFPRAKGFLYDPGIKVPLVMQWEDVIEPGIRGGLTSLIDLTPTLLDLLEIKIADDFHGKSFLPLLADEHVAGRTHIYTERNWHDLDDHIRSVRTSHYKYIRNYYPWQPYTLPADVYGSPSFKSMRKLRDAGELDEPEQLIFRQPRPEEELYNLDEDPNEFHNLAEDSDYRDVLVRLREDTESWEDRTHDVSPAKRKPNRANYWKHVHDG